MAREDSGAINSGEWGACVGEHRTGVLRGLSSWSKSSVASIDAMMR
jgi:hypothetical protein